MSARKEQFRGDGRFGRDFVSPLARFTQEPFVAPLITREQLVANLAEAGAQLTTRINVLGDMARELKVRHARVLTAIPRMGIVDTARQKLLGHQREIPHLLQHWQDIKTQLGSVRANQLLGALMGAEALMNNRDYFGRLALQLNASSTISTSPLFFPVLDNFESRYQARKKGKREESKKGKKDHTKLFLIASGAVSGVVLIGGAIMVGANVPDDGSGPIIHPTRTPAPTDGPNHDSLYVKPNTTTFATPTPTATAIATEIAMGNTTKPTIILCPSPDGKSPVLIPDNLKGKIDESQVQIKPVPDDQQERLAKLYAAIEAKNFPQDTVVMCTPNNSIGEAGVSYVVQVYSFTELTTGKLTAVEHLFVDFGDNRGLIGTREDRLLTPGGNNWLIEKGYDAAHFVMGKEGDANYLDAVLYYKLNPSTGNEYIAGVLTKDGLLTGKDMVDRYKEVLAKTPFAVATRISDINNGHQVAYFGYSEVQFEGQTVLQLTAYDKDGQVIWPATVEQGAEAFQTVQTNDKVFDLLKTKGAGEVTFDGIKWHTTINGKEAIFSGASIEDPTFAYLYAKDGSRIWVVNDKGTDFKEIVLNKIGRYRGSDGTVKEIEMDSPVGFGNITRSESGRLTDGLFFYYPEWDEWYAVDNLNLPTPAEWAKTRAQRKSQWVETVKITREKGRTTEFTAEQIRAYLRQYIKYIDADDSVLTSIDTKEGPKLLLVDRKYGLIPIEPGAYRDPGLLMVTFVKEIRLDSRVPTALVNYGEAKVGMMRLNPTGLLAGWDKRLMGASITNGVAKEASGIEWMLKQASSSCTKGVSSILIKIFEAYSNIPSIKVWQSFLRHLSDNDPAENVYEYNLPFHLLNRANDYQNPNRWPACFY